VVGEPREKAVEELNDAGFEVDLAERPSSEVAEGLVSRTLPSAGTERRGGSRIQVFVSSGPRQVEVPNVIGSSRGAATVQLRGEGLEVAVDESPSDEPRGQVTAQSPSPGTSVQEGAQVTITVSSGGGGSGGGSAPRDQPQQEARSRVPGVVGLSQEQAESRLRAAGFGVSVREQEVDSEGEDGQVLRQSPSGGSELRSGGTVTIVVGRFEEPPKEPDPGGGNGGGGEGGGTGGSLGGKRSS
jgi:serine/threonine-protein kinase